MDVNDEHVKAVGREVAGNIRAYLAAGGKLHSGGVIRPDDQTVAASTSAHLRDTQRALAASQADLTRATDQHAATLNRLIEVEKERDEALVDLAVRTGQLQWSRGQLDLTTAELASARAEIERLRREMAWQTGRTTHDTPRTDVPGPHEGEQ